MIEQQLNIATDDGDVPRFIAHPEGAGPYSVVLVLMDGMPGGESYHEEASELVWRRIETLFARKLAGASR